MLAELASWLCLIRQAITRVSCRQWGSWRFLCFLSCFCLSFGMLFEGVNRRGGSSAQQNRNLATPAVDLREEQPALKTFRRRHLFFVTVRVRDREVRLAPTCQDSGIHPVAFEFLLDAVTHTQAKQPRVRRRRWQCGLAHPSHHGVFDLSLGEGMVVFPEVPSAVHVQGLRSGMKFHVGRTGLTAGYRLAARKDGTKRGTRI